MIHLVFYCINEYHVYNDNTTTYTHDIYWRNETLDETLFLPQMFQTTKIKCQIFLKKINKNLNLF